MVAKKKAKSGGAREPDTRNIVDALAEISEAVTSDLYLDDILKLIVTVTAEAMGSKICSLLLLDKKGKELAVKATQSVSEAYNKKPNIKIGEGIAGRVVKEGKPITVPDVRKDKYYINTEIAKKEKLCSLLCVPLACKGKVIGALNSYTSKPHKFSKSEINILKSIANQAAIVIENTQLMVKTKIIQEELETRKLVERAKGILMKEGGLTEDQAYRRIQKKSMDSRKSMREIAEAVILSCELQKYKVK